MRKVALLFLLIAVVVLTVAPATQAMSTDEIAKKLGGTWIMVKASGMFQQYNMGKPAMLYLRPNGTYFYYQISIKGKGYFIVKGKKWEIKPGVDGADGMIYMAQTHKGGKKGRKMKWKAAKTKVGGPVKFLSGGKAIISFLDLSRFDLPPLNDFMNLVWKKK